MDRKSVILSKITKAELGLEIGPSFNPVVQKKAGYEVETIDYMDKEQLINKYREHANTQLLIDEIEDVDYVWKGGSYAELTRKSQYYDYIVASHVIEHTPNFIEFMKDCSKMLKDSGKIYLVVPDMRYEFDCMKPVTFVGTVLDDYFMNRKVHSPGSVAEHYLYSVRGDALMGSGPCQATDFWGNYAYPLLDTFHCPYPVNAIIREIAKANLGEYVDTHHYRFTPSSFELLIQDLKILEYIDLTILEVTKTHHYEFIVTLSKQEEELNDQPVRRMQLLRNIKQELNEYMAVSKAMSVPKTVINSEAVEFCVDEVSRIQNAIFIRGWAIHTGYASEELDVFVSVLKKNQSKRVLFSTTKLCREDVMQCYQKEQFYVSGFLCVLEEEYENELILEKDKIDIVIRYQNDYYENCAKSYYHQKESNKWRFWKKK